MNRAGTSKRELDRLVAQSDPPPWVLYGETDIDLWLYRKRTIALLRRYARCSVEVGRIPSLLGREFFRSRVTSYTMRNFEDVVIFVTDMEQALDKLTPIERKMLAMNVLEEYSQDEVARLLSCNIRTIRRLIQDSVDQLSRILLTGGLMEELPLEKIRRENCQEGGKANKFASDSKDGRNKYQKIVRSPPSNLIS